MHGESDLLPGLVVDRYDDTLVLQALTCGVERWRHVIARLLLQATGCTEVFERSDAGVRALEGLAPRVGFLLGGEGAEGGGSARGEKLGKATVREGELAFEVDLLEGHKTGWYLDQRDNRRIVRALAHGKTVLDVFCYHGGFALNALLGGATHVTAVDSSAHALAALERNLILNADTLPRQRDDGSNVHLQRADAFSHLRDLVTQGKVFDLVVLDPPKLAKNKQQTRKALRAYKDINRLALLLLPPGGTLVTFSCSHSVDSATLRSVVAAAAVDAGVEVQVHQSLVQPSDHPVLLSFPQGAYLKGLVCVRL